MSHTWIFQWGLDDNKVITLDRDGGSLRISTKTGGNWSGFFSFQYGDPRKLAEVLSEIAASLRKCQRIVSYDDRDVPIFCDDEGTVLDVSEFYKPVFCDEHHREHEQRMSVAQSSDKTRDVVF
jgi:hypothetical protein